MPQKQKKDRDQLRMLSLSEHVPDDSVARIIDAFINAADLPNLGFEVKGNSHEGRPAYAPDTLAKLYLYGYLNGIRSSRKLENACRVNIELWWLLNDEKPKFKTIANFRKDNPTGFANLFAFFRDFCLDLGLYGKSTIAVDRSKFRAQNSMKNNYNERKIKKHLDYIDGQHQEYLKKLDENDQFDNDGAIKKKLDQRKGKYLNLQNQLDNTDNTQISTTDPDARSLPLKMRIVEVSYNLQSAVDDKHNLVADFQITNKADHRALAPMALKAKKALKIGENDPLTVLADKGYHTGEQMQTCHDNNIETIVAAPRKPKQTDKTKPPHLRKDNFKFNTQSNTYTCPNGQILNHQATYQRKSRRGIPAGKFNRYTIKFSICKTCPFFEQCVSKGNRSGHQGRYIDRKLSDKAVEKNKDNLINKRQLYKKRQAIVEHPFGTIKRQWGYSYTLLKTIPKVQTEFSIIMLCYNLRRTMSIIGHNELNMALNRLFYPIFLTTDSMNYYRFHYSFRISLAPLRIL